MLTVFFFLGLRIQMMHFNKCNLLLLISIHFCIFLGYWHDFHFHFFSWNYHLQHIPVIAYISLFLHTPFPLCILSFFSPYLFPALPILSFSSTYSSSLSSFLPLNNIFSSVGKYDKCCPDWWNKKTTYFV